MAIMTAASHDLYPRHTGNERLPTWDRNADIFFRTPPLIINFRIALNGEIYP